jgi:hypothetical protein
MRLSLLLSSVLMMSLPLQAQFVFPGDLNNDGRANHIDLLPLAVEYGRRGPAREVPDLEWMPKAATLWESGLPVTGVDLAFVDGNGDGQLDSLDIDAIILNYDSTQVAALPPPQPYLLTDTFRLSNPPFLSARFDRTTARAGDTLRITIGWEVPNPDLFPPEKPPVGFAFRIRFDPEFFQINSLRIIPNTATEGLMYVAAASNFAEGGRQLDPGILEVAVAAKGNADLLRSQEVAEVIIIIEDMILLTGNPRFELDGPLVLNAVEEVVAASGYIDTLLVVYNENLHALPPLQVWPNPCHNHLRGQASQAPNARVEAWTIRGQLQHSTFTDAYGNWFFNTSTWPPGQYRLRIQSPQQTTFTTIIKI